jgi:hypothetical protein
MSKSINAEAIRTMICYYYLVSFWSPEFIGELKKTGQKWRKKYAKDAGLKISEFSEKVIPEVAKRMIAFHQATKKPDGDSIQTLTKVLKKADCSQKGAEGFQQVMREVAAHRERAKVGSRLHSQKGCRICFAPCQYGYFTLMSEPDFKSLKAMLDAENKKIADERNAVNVLWAYTREHFWSVLGTQEGYISASHLGNLSYCLLMLGTAKSRFALPEKELITYQAMNQLTIRNMGSTDINLVAPK